MPGTVYVLFETNDRGGSTIGVFADRGMALEAARSWALWRARRCHEMDVKTFGPAGAGSYAVVVEESDEGADVSVVHSPSGEHDDRIWRVSPFEIVAPPTHAEAEQPDLFPSPPQECAT